jgi:hypothetical protein
MKTELIFKSYICRGSIERVFERIVGRRTDMLNACCWPVDICKFNVQRFTNSDKFSISGNNPYSHVIILLILKK